MAAMAYLLIALLLTGCSTTQLCIGTCDVKSQQDMPKVEHSAQP